MQHSLTPRQLGAKQACTVPSDIPLGTWGQRCYLGPRRRPRVGKGEYMRGGTGTQGIGGTESRRPLNPSGGPSQCCF